MVMGAVYVSDGMWALVEGVVLSCSSTVVVRWWRLRLWIWRMVWAYLDGGNGVGKILS
jgi:hypothetical protein